jgi:hypothetical protein
VVGRNGTNLGGEVGASGVAELLGVDPSAQS